MEGSNARQAERRLGAFMVRHVCRTNVPGDIHARNFSSVGYFENCFEQKLLHSMGTLG